MGWPWVLFSRNIPHPLHKHSACPNMCVPSQLVQQGNSQYAQPCFVWVCWMWALGCFFSGLWLFGNANGCLLYCPCNICLPFRWLVSWSFGTRDLTKQIKGFQRTDCMNTSIPIVNTLIFPVSSLTSKLSLLVCFNNETNLWTKCVRAWWSPRGHH